MELSTNMPPASVMPARLITFTFRSNTHKAIKVPMMLTGMANPTTKVVLAVRRNRKRIVTARMLPMTRFFCTRLMEL